MERSNEGPMPKDDGIPLGFVRLNRKDFLVLLSLGLGGLAATVIAIPVIGALVAPWLRKAPEFWRPVGPVDSFKIGDTVVVTFENPSPLPWSGLSAKSAAYLRRDGLDQFTAFSINCTHLGCPVRWLADANLFMCPCHGGVYYQDGSVAAGPPPLPLPQYPVRVNNGQVEVHTTPVPITPFSAQ
jgi:menaquinol-cytochrome c reductase iron-sulfur subunit